MVKAKMLSVLDDLIGRGQHMATQLVPGLLTFIPPGNAGAFHIECLETIKLIVSEESRFFRSFSDIPINYYGISEGVEILKAIRRFVDNELVSGMKNMISREFYGEVAESAKDFLQKGFRVNAAVHMGTALEKRIHDLCTLHGLPLKGPDEKKYTPTNTLNDDLKKNGVYGQVTHKHILSWLAIRNSAAHGRGDEFTDAQVDLMIDGVKDFLDTHPA